MLRKRTEILSLGMELANDIEPGPHPVTYCNGTAARPPIAYNILNSTQGLETSQIKVTKQRSMSAPTRAVRFDRYQGRLQLSKGIQLPDTTTYLFITIGNTHLDIKGNYWFHYAPLGPLPDAYTIHRGLGAHIWGSPPSAGGNLELTSLVSPPAETWRLCLSAGNRHERPRATTIVVYTFSINDEPGNSQVQSTLEQSTFELVATSASNLDFSQHVLPAPCNG